MPGRPAPRLSTVRAWAPRLLLGVLALLLGIRCGGGDTAITVSPASHDFGRVMRGDTRQQRFTITNHGDRPAGITVRSSCACLKVTQDSLATLDPGAQMGFTVRLATTELPPQRLLGKYVVVHTDLPDGEKAMVPVEGEIFRAYRMAPTLFDLGHIEGGPEDYAAHTITVHPEECEAVRLAGFRATPDVFDVQAVPAAEGGLTVSIMLREGTQRPLGKFLAQVRLDLELKLPGGEVGHDHPLVTLRGLWIPR